VRKVKEVRVRAYREDDLPQLTRIWNEARRGSHEFIPYTDFISTECVWGFEPDWELKAYLRAISKGKALDLGLGEGRNALFLARSGFEVEGIDLSQEAVRRCNELAQGKVSCWGLPSILLRSCIMPRP